MKSAQTDAKGSDREEKERAWFSNNLNGEYARRRICKGKLKREQAVIVEKQPLAIFAPRVPESVEATNRPQVLHDCIWIHVNHIPGTNDLCQLPVRPKPDARIVSCGDPGTAEICCKYDATFRIHCEFCRTKIAKHNSWAKVGPMRLSSLSSNASQNSTNLRPKSFIVAAVGGRARQRLSKGNIASLIQAHLGNSAGKTSKTYIGSKVGPRTVDARARDDVELAARVRPDS